MNQEDIELLPGAAKKKEVWLQLPFFYTNNLSGGQIKHKHRRPISRTDILKAHRGTGIAKISSTCCSVWQVMLCTCPYTNKH